jgi:hypothetical protein
LTGLALVAGCGSPPQVGTSNYRSVAALRISISARRLDLLDAAAKTAAELHAAAQLSVELFAVLESIIAQTRGGDWADAETQVVRLAKAQHATTEEIEQLKAKKPRPRNR